MTYSSWIMMGEARPGDLVELRDGRCGEAPLLRGVDAPLLRGIVTTTTGTAGRAILLVGGSGGGDGYAWLEPTAEVRVIDLQAALETASAYYRCGYQDGQRDVGQLVIQRVLETVPYIGHYAAEVVNQAARQVSKEIVEGQEQAQGQETRG